MIIVFAPYTRHFEVFNSGLVRSPETTLPHQYLAHFGLFAGFAFAFVAVRCHEELHARGGPRNNPVLALTAGRVELAALFMFAAGLAFFTWRFGVTVIALSVLAELLLVNLLWLDLRAKERDLARLLATALFALGFAVAAGVDVVTVRNDIERMNTVFKFSLEAWQLFALASAFGAWYAGCYLWNVDGFRVRPRPGRMAAATAGLAAAALLLLGAGIYVFSGTPRRENARFAALPRSLNGLNYLQTATFTEDCDTPSPSDDVTIRLADDEPLIRWLRENVQGSPVIVEAIGPLYHWTGRISVNTGLPAVIGWDWHETQQRWGYAGLVSQRRTDTQRFFTDMGSAEAAQYLRLYDVSYIVVGTEERVLGTPEGLAKFALMPSLQEVFRSGPYAFYHVNQGSLPP